MKTTLLLILLQLGASGSDAYFTHRNSRLPGFYEANPIVRPFVKTTGGTAAYFGGSAALKIGSMLLLRKRGHRKLSTIVGLAEITDNAQGAFYSAIH